jgi:hypothetical protein
MTDNDYRTDTGTADYEFHPYESISVRITDFLSFEDIAERNRYIWECRMFLFLLLGAFVQCGSILYWKVKKFRNLIISKVLYIKRLGFWSGFMSQSRGLHWKR